MTRVLQITYSLTSNITEEEKKVFVYLEEYSTFTVVYQCCKHSFIDCFNIKGKI